MRDRETIEREIYRAREDLEASLNELRHVVQNKVDMKARTRVAVEKGKQQAQDLFELGKVQARELAHNGAAKARELAVRGKDGAREIYIRGRETVEERPVLVGSIVVGVIAVGAFIYIARKNDWWGWFERDVT
ncbi:MAG TPA: hypothetical protein VLB44_04780 [Kofleriaceae bacterium]|nr:hypothetical protein [Kofleriaceae bacterium]